VPAAILGCTVAGQLRLVLHPGAGLADGGFPCDVAVDLVPPDLRMPNTPLWVALDEQRGIVRVWRREQPSEAERRDAVGRYNESTFGERGPIASAFLRLAVFVAVAAVLLWLVPRRARWLVGLLMGVAFAVWEARRNGWASYGGWSSLRYPWRRW
jgi:hypothetical protein